ncbi:LytTR family DNA-binding domain-containing protein [Aneurinibacillus tyrosinisolvens]|uniref:LytTR family DNA-binding domain-containing protein n=1 Tax=Aneurinibacillus tyrosinisolvens TaxID=1443435 RepID=UPI00063EE764|nr:LytTR family DNA-binding domain-containing protein [Aneurinibacillus tyrosinisolvens]
MEIESVLSLVKSINRAFPPDASIAIADQSKFVYYQPSLRIDLKIKPGDTIQEGTLTRQALERGADVSKYVDETVFGVPYYATSTLIIDRNGTEGCITTIFPPGHRGDEARPLRHQFLIGKGEDRWIPIPFHEIFFIESQNGKTFLHTERGVYMNKYSLLELESVLPFDRFIRCHRAYLVNVGAILEIHPDFHSTFVIITADEKRSRVPVSQKYASSFRRFMGF